MTIKFPWDAVSGFKKLVAKFPDTSKCDVKNIFPKNKNKIILDALLIFQNILNLFSILAL